MPHHRFLQSQWPTVLSALTLPAVYVLFAYAHWQAYVATQRSALVLIAGCEALVAMLYLARRQPVTVSAHAGDWLLGIGGTLLPMLLRPGGPGYPAIGDPLLEVGAGLLIVSLLSLNRSLAVVPARRDIKTTGLYRLVRHPVYLSYVVLFTGYVLANASAANIAIWAATLACLWARIWREEAHLMADAAYRDYMQVVRYRIIPFLL